MYVDGQVMTWIRIAQQQCWHKCNSQHRKYGYNVRFIIWLQLDKKKINKKYMPLANELGNIARLIVVSESFQ